MPSFNEKTLAYQVQNANSVTIMMGDVVIGFGQTTTPTIDWGTEQLYGIGSALPQDIQQLKINPNLSIDQFMLTASGLKLLGYPSTMLEVLSNNQFDFHVIGSDGAPLLTYVGCVAANFNMNIPANQVISETVSFLARDVLDALGNTVLSGNNALKSAAELGGALNNLGL